MYMYIFVVKFILTSFTIFKVYVFYSHALFWVKTGASRKHILFLSVIWVGNNYNRRLEDTLKCMYWYKYTRTFTKSLRFITVLTASLGWYKYKFIKAAFSSGPDPNSIRIQCISGSGLDQGNQNGRRKKEKYSIFHQTI